MKKQKMKLLAVALAVLFAGGIFANKAEAAASATVSWTPPTTDEGGGALTGLAGYKVYYNTTSTWLSHITACTGLGGTTIDVPGGATTSYLFENTLTPGSTYYFAVAAYDTAGTPNISKCALTGGSLTEISKQVSYTADLDSTGGSLHKVDLLDFNAFRSNWGNTTCNNVANFTGKISNCAVNLLDFNILRADFNSSF